MGHLQSPLVYVGVVIQFLWIFLLEFSLAHPFLVWYGCWLDLVHDLVHVIWEGVLQRQSIL
jgi:hypothetical protein